MVVRHDYLALDWVKGEIEETLNQAQYALEAYVESPEDSSQMRFCQAYLHQVRGTLQMVEFYGAALLAEEMEQLSQALLAGEVTESQQDVAHEVLLKAMLQLPFYIEKIRASRRDLPLMLLPLLNDLRAVRGEALLSETALFKPDLAQSKQGQVPEAIAKHPKFAQLTQKIRRHYQSLLLLLLRNQADAQHLKQLEKLLDQLATLTGEAAMLPLWQAAAAVVELLANETASSNTIKQLLGEIDKQLKLLTEQGVSFLYQAPPTELLKNLLFFVASHDEHKSARFELLRQQFKLADALPQSVRDGGTSDPLAGLDDKTIESVVQALVEELEAIKLALDLFANRSGLSVEELRPQAEQLKQAADTVAMLGLGQPRAILEGQHQLLLKMIADGLAADPEVLLEIAGALLLVESMLKSVDQKIISTGEWKETPSQMDGARDIVIQECRAGLEEAKQGIVDYIASHWDVTYLEKVPTHLTNVRGGLELILQADAANVLRQCLAYIQTKLMPSGGLSEQPEWGELDALADAITSIDYYLERLADDEVGTGTELIDIAQNSVAMLGFPVSQLAHTEDAQEALAELEPTSVVEKIVVEEAAEAIDENSFSFELPAVDFVEEPTNLDEAKPFEEELSLLSIAEDTESGSDDDLIDDEIIEIFVEEAGEVLAALDEYFPRWVKNQYDDEALIEFRRAFHTLKGSGRMVGAHTVGELAWSVENMMNRVIDKSIEPTQQLIELVRRVHAAIPELVNAFALRQPDPFDVSFLEAAAHSLAEGATDIALLSEEVGAGIADALVEPDEAEPAKVQDIAAATLPPGVDTVLVDIFRTESYTNLELAARWLNELDRDLSTFVLSDQLHRALHTLKGSARMAEVEAMAEVAESAEQLVKDMISHGEKADYEVVQLIEDVIATLTKATAQAYPHMPRISAAEPLLERLADAQKNVRKQREQLDQTALTHFLSEGIGLVMDAEDQLKLWIHQPDATESLQLLEEELVLLGKHAAAAGLVEIESLALALAAVYRQVLQQDVAKNDDTVALLEDSHEALMVMIDCLAAGLTVRSANELITQLAMLANSGDTNTASALDAAVTSMPEVELAADEFQLPILEEVTDSSAEPVSEPDASEPAVEATPFDEQVDLDLLAIFLEEADEIMLEISEQLHSWQADPQNLHPVQLLQRGLHTLKGGARMAEISALGNLGHELENLYEGLANGQLQSNITLFSLLHACQDRLAEMVDELRNESMPAEATSLLDAINRYLANPEGFEWLGDAQVPMLMPEPTESEPTQDSDEVEQDAIKASADQEILQVFLEEAEELIEDLDANVNAWREAPEDPDYADSIKRILHTLKGGARLAGLHKLGDASHDVEAFLIERTHQVAVPQASFFEALNEQSHHIASMLERTVNAVPEPPVRTQLVQVSAEQEQAEQLQRQTDRLERLQRQQQPQEMVRVASELLEGLVNLAGETSINRGRVEQGINEFASYVDEMGNTVARLYEQLRRLDVETEAQILSNYQQGVEQGKYQEDGFDPLEMDQYSELNQITRQLSESASDLLDLKSTLVDKIRDTETLLLQQGRINTELQEKLMQTRMVPFSRLVPRLRRIVRQISSELGKQVHLEVSNAESELDRSLLERIIAPLEHMLRNAVDHGIEINSEREALNKPKQGNIVLELMREGGEIVLTLADDGRGIDIEAVRRKAIERGLIDEEATLTEQEILQFLFHSGFSTAEKVTQVSGRGVGMDVVGSEIKQMGGSVSIQSVAGEGTKFTVRLPFTLAMSSALMVKLGEDMYAIPLSQIEGIVRVSPYELEEYFVTDPPPFTYANQQYDFEYLGQLVQGRLKPNLEGQIMPLPVLLIRSSEYTMALLLDDLMGSREVVIKPLGPQLSTVPGLSGATILGDGNVVVVLDIHSLIRATHVQRQSLAAEERRAQLLAAHEQAQLEEQQEEAQRAPLIMVTDDSVTVRRVSTRLLERQGYEVVTAKDGIDAIAVLEEYQPDLMLLDIEMPRMDGYEVAMHVRREERLRDIPIIMITSRTGEKHRERAFDIGVNAYMGKPFQEGELLTAIRELLEQGTDSNESE